MTTTLWVTMALDGTTTPSGSMVYECPLLGTEYYPLSISNAVISKLIITLQLAKPSCTISAPPSITLPPLSQDTENSSMDLSITINCEGFSDSAPDVSLLLKGNQTTSEGYLSENDNTIFEMLYGDDVSGSAGQIWKADNATKYPLGKAATTIIATPKVKVLRKEGAAAGEYKATATVTVNVE